MPKKKKKKASSAIALARMTASSPNAWPLRYRTHYRPLTRSLTGEGLKFIRYDEVQTLEWPRAGASRALNKVRFPSNLRMLYPRDRIQT